MQEWTKSYIELTTSYVHPKNSNNLRSHLRAIMALDHRKINLIGLEKNQVEFFCVRQVYFTKSCQQIWVRVNQPFIPFIHHIWGETVLWGTVFIIQTSDRMWYFTILQHKLHSLNIQDGRSTRGLLAKSLIKFPKSHIRQAGSHFCSASCSECLNEHTRVKLQHNKEIIMFIFLFNGFIDV